MEVRPKRAARDWGWAWWERGLLAVVGVGAAVGAIWLTGVTLLMFAIARCDGASGREAFGMGIVYGAAWAVGAGVAIAVAVSLLRVSAGRRGLRTRSWIAVPAVLAVVAVGYGAASPPRQPTSPGTCQDLQLH